MGMDAADIAGPAAGAGPTAGAGPVEGDAPSAGARPARIHRRGLTIARSSLLLAAALVVCLAVMVAVGVQLIHGMGAVADGWRAYDLQAATKSDALSEVRGHLGLGGVIDRFHEHRLSGDVAGRAALERALMLARANLGIYRDIVTPTESEDRAIGAIAIFLDAVEQRMTGGSGEDFDERRRAAVQGLATLNAHLSVERARLTAMNLDGIEDLQRLMAVGGGGMAALVLGLAGAAVWFTRSRIVGPLGRLVEDARRLARRDLDLPFLWTRRDELGLLGRTLEDSRAALRDLFAAIEEKTRRLSESERRYAMAAEATNDGLWDWDLSTGAFYVSPRLRQMLHLSAADGVKDGIAPLLGHVHPRDRGAVEAAFRKAERGGTEHGFEVEFRTVPGEVEAPWILLHGIVARDAGGRVVRLAGSASDISERKSYEARLVHQATHDFLTGLPNRAFLVQWLRDRQEAARGGPRADLALLFLDLDGFKVINDTLSHAVGDRVLVATAERVAALLGEGEFAVRLGGDEFVVTVPAGQTAAVARAQALEAAFQAPIGIGSMDLRVGLSIGLAVDDGTSDDPDHLLRDADIALYRAKERGKGQTVLFDASLREAILIRSRLQRDLTPSIAAGDVFLVYQPIVALPAGEVVGFEALVRWRHPDLGIVSPAQFIPIAEETGQILPLGRHVMELAVAQLARWRRLVPDLTVNVNLSARQMWDDRYVDELLEFLSGSDARGLKVEVTESMTVNDHDQARTILERFHALGVPLCMDDFGTGYSSLSHLSRLPFDVLKIDRSFVSALGDDPRQETLLRGIVELAHTIGLSVVAEGVETVRERDIVIRIGCDYGQGYLFARPLSVADAEALLRSAVPQTTV